MATGFASVQRNTVNKDPGYKTLFERVTAATGGEKKSSPGTEMLSKQKQVNTKRTSTNIS